MNMGGQNGRQAKRSLRSSHLEGPKSGSTQSDWFTILHWCIFSSLCAPHKFGLFYECFSRKLLILLMISKCELDAPPSFSTQVGNSRKPFSRALKLQMFPFKNFLYLHASQRPRSDLNAFRADLRDANGVLRKGWSTTDGQRAKTSQADSAFLAPTKA